MSKNQTTDLRDRAAAIFAEAPEEEKCKIMSRAVVNAFFEVGATPSELLAALFMSLGHLIEQHFEEDNWGEMLDYGFGFLQKTLKLIPPGLPDHFFTGTIKTTSGLHLVCPYCSFEMDSATSVGGKHTPSPGDASVCFNCAQFLTFDENLNLTIPPSDLLKRIEQDEMLSRLAEQIRNRDRRSPEEKAAAQS